MAKVKKTEAQDQPKQGRDSVTLEVKQQRHYGVPIGHRRTFSNAEHGDAFEEKATEWAQHFGAEEVA